MPTQEVIVDNTDSGFSSTGNWPASEYSGAYGTNSLYNTVNDGSAARWTAPLTGEYAVYAWWTSGPGRVIDATYSVQGTAIVVNQKADGGKWNYLGNFDFSGTAVVELSDQSEDPDYDPNTISNSVCADAIRFVPGCVMLTDLIAVVDQWKAGSRTLTQVMETIQRWKIC